MYPEIELLNWSPVFLCRDRNELAETVALLKTQIDPELLKKDQEAKRDGQEEQNAEGQSLILKWLI